MPAPEDSVYNRVTTRPEPAIRIWPPSATSRTLATMPKPAVTYLRIWGARCVMKHWTREEWSQMPKWARPAAMADDKGGYSLFEKAAEDS